MATLNINGRRVTVDDGFLQLSSDEQSRTVEEIASRLSQQAKAPPSGKHLTFEEGQTLLDAEGASGTVGAGLTGMVQGVPIVGPAVLGGLQRAGAGIRSLINGDSYDENLQQVQQKTEAAQAAHPNVTLGGEIAGNVGSLIPLGATSMGARALGITGPNLLARAGASGLSGAAISAADTAARGGSAKDVLGSAEIGGGVSAAVPVVGRGIEALVRGAGSVVAPRIAAITNPTQEASRRVGVAISRDAAANASGVMSTADEAMARAANIPIVNADRGGEVTRALARSAANQSPEARAAIEKTASDRFGAQSQRAIDFIKKVTGGNVDDLAYQDTLRQTAKSVNDPAYRAAFGAPEAQVVFTPGLQELMQSPSVRAAVAKVPSRSADRGAVQGFKEIGNPFSVNSQGAYVLRRKADGTLVAPSLQFWDQVKRNIDSQISKARGDNTRMADLMALKNKLVGELDSAVPSYRSARQGAAAFFDAEDALDAGKKFANTPRLIPEAKRAFASFSPAEKNAFSTGYASELIDKIRASGDRTNVINNVFKSQASRESLDMVLGPQKARQIEAYVRVEDLADRLRGAMGNSTTARQLVELGIGAGGGYGITGDWKGALTGAALMKGARYVGERADAKVMESVAKLLTQDNPSALAVAVQQASRNPAYMDALERISSAIAPASRGVAVSVGTH